MRVRIDMNSRETLLSNLITKRTGCSPFESEVIVNKSKEAFSIGEYAERQRLKAGQLIWLCVSAEETSGKPLKECKLRRDVLPYQDKVDAEDVWVKGEEMKSDSSDDNGSDEPGIIVNPRGSCTHIGE